MDFTEQIAIVTSATSKIGQAVVQMLAERGARIVASHNGHEEQAVALPQAFIGLPGTVIVQQADVRERSGAETLVAAALERWGRVDILITCEMNAYYASISDLSLEQWHTTLSANLDSVYHIAKAVLRPMMRQRYGRIVNIGALHGEGGGPGQADFSAAMAGVFGLTRALAREAAAWSITANAVAAGLVAAEVLDTMPNEMRAWGERIIALRRIGKPDEVAAAAVFLASPLASYITGQTLAVDGGWRMV